MNISKNRKERLARLREIISSNPNFTQLELVQKMSKKGYDVTQASISRDIKALGIHKKEGEYVKDTTLASFVKRTIKSCEMSGDNLVVVKTIPGAANYVAEWIDGEENEGIVGTVAGDNTFFIAASNKKAAKKINDKLNSLIVS